MKSLNYLIGHILYQIFKIALTIMANMNKIENRITFNIKTGFYLELLTLETMKLLGSTKNKQTKDEYDENVRPLEIT